MKREIFNLPSFLKAKSTGHPISMVTCYDSTFAKLVEKSSIDCILVGDSVAMTMHGHSDTLKATPEMMATHVEAVRRGAPTKFIVADLPFLVHRGSLDETMKAVRLIMSAGANAVKIEGIDGSEQTFHHIVESGVPVMGHLGLTPQSVNVFGGFRVQGKTLSAAEAIKKQAIKLESTGVFAIVLECVPSTLANEITKASKVPTIGIGAGNGCDGQVLVIQDLLGLNTDFRPKFVRQFGQLAEPVATALKEFDLATKDRTFPAASESFTSEPSA
jgi:3-methyl-2-oxobutanoate hydroxymethyltransferase